MKRTIAYLILAGLLAACSEREQPAPAAVQRTPVRLTASIDRITYLSTDIDFATTFQTGDKLGVYAVAYLSGQSETLQGSGNYADNIPFAFDGTEWSGELYHPRGDSLLDLYVYYPYDEDFVAPWNFSVATDQSAAADYARSDLLWRMSGGIDSGTTPTITLHHRMALVQLVVEGTPAPTSVELIGAELDGTYDMGSEGTFSVSGLATNVVMHQLNDTTFRALIPPQTLQAGPIFRLDGSETYDQDTPTTFTKGEVTRYKITLP